MKTKLLFSLVWAIFVLGAFPSRADGWLQFANTPPGTRVYERDPFTLELTLVPTNGGKVELLYAAPGTTDLSLFHTVPGESPVTIFPAPGRFTGGTYLLTDIAPGAMISAVVRGWTGLFESWDAAVNSGTAKLGISEIFLIDTTDPNEVPVPAPPANIASSVPGQGFSGLILQVPEPSSLVLCGFGLGSLFAFHRRSRSNA